MSRSSALASSGLIIRYSLFHLFNLMLTSIYLTLIITGYLTGATLAIILVGVPIIMFTSASARWMAAFDRRLTYTLFSAEDPALPLPQPRPRTTLQSIGDLTAKFLLSTLAVSVISTLLPFYILEVILEACGVETGNITARVIYALTAAITGLDDMTDVDDELTLARQKLKHDDLTADALDEQPSYFIGDDGEIEIDTTRS